VLGDAGSLLTYEVSGDGFLRHMVRAIVGTLVEVGRGWRDPAQMDALLQARDRARAGATAPPHGLFLVRVDYD
jgi:tRNA pseudouridine38-40 synthase